MRADIPEDIENHGWQLAEKIPCPRVQPGLLGEASGCVALCLCRMPELFLKMDALCRENDFAAANDAIVIALCSADGIAKDNEERMMHCHHMLERGLSLGMDASDLWFDPLFLVVKGMQDKQMDVLNAIKMFADEGLKSTGGLSNNSNGAPKAVRPILDSTLVAMAMMQGLTSAIVNPNDLRLMETIKSCDIFKNHVLYSDSYLDE